MRVHSDITVKKLLVFNNNNTTHVSILAPVQEGESMTFEPQTSSMTTRPPSLTRATVALTSSRNHRKGKEAAQSAWSHTPKKHSHTQPHQNKQNPPIRALHQQTCPQLLLNSSTVAQICPQLMILWHQPPQTKHTARHLLPLSILHLYQMHTLIPLARCRPLLLQELVVHHLPCHSLRATPKLPALWEHL